MSIKPNQTKVAELTLALKTTADTLLQSHAYEMDALHATYQSKMAEMQSVIDAEKSKITEMQSVIDAQNCKISQMESVLLDCHQCR